MDIPHCTYKHINGAYSNSVQVFEYLRASALPEFTSGNWRSRIRSEVRVLPQFEELQNWEAAEISDIMMEDDQGALELLLRSVASNAFATWEEASPAEDQEVRASEQHLKPTYIQLLTAD